MIEIRGGIRSRSQADGGEAGDNTYTPMTDCFFGGSLLMFATGDQAIKRLRGDGRMKTTKRRWMGVEDGRSTEKNLYAEKRVRESEDRKC